MRNLVFTTFAKARCFMQKRLAKVLVGILILSAFTISCEKEEKASKVDSDGLSAEIRRIVPDSILEKLKSMGMPINGGANPPLLINASLPGTYFVDDRTVKSTNIPNDNVKFLDYKITFSEQDNDKLTIKFDYVSHHKNSNSTEEKGAGLGSFIVGEGCKFSIFTEVNSTIKGSRAKTISVISGTLLAKGITDFYLGYILKDDFGDPQGVFIKKGQGRVMYETDGFAELVGSNAKWYSQLPDCPCEYNKVKNLGKTLCPEGEWIDCGEADQNNHYGATYEVRWRSSRYLSPGQQCCYDKFGKLITSGIAAGSPDKYSPRTCEGGNPALLDVINHRLYDVNPASEMSCEAYLSLWPSNNEDACDQNAVSDIKHMQNLVKGLTCPEIVEIFKVIETSTSPANSNELKLYFKGKLNYVPTNLKQKLTTIYEDIDASGTNNKCTIYRTLGCGNANRIPDTRCRAFFKAICNL